MESIFLPQLLRAPQQTDVIPVNITFPDLETLTPVQGEIRVVHCGNYIRVETHAETIVTLTCDRCLQQYNHRLVTNASELIWLEQAETEAEWESLSFEEPDDSTLDETLPANGYFHPDDWLYQHLCLDLPQRHLCQEDCLGVPYAAEATKHDSIDHRWAALQSLREQL